MSKRREHVDLRCKKCLINMQLCFCHEIKPIPTHTKISLLVHTKEKYLSSNTASLAHLALTNSQVYYRGEKEKLLSSEFRPQENLRSLYLYPSADAHVLNQDFLDQNAGPYELIIPDGTWRQASKFHKREVILQNVPHVKLDLNLNSIYALRKQKYDYGVCTMEAIAYALGIIEGQAIQDQLLAMLAIKNRQVLQSRALPVISC
jgi:DTW domain-containing protein